LTDLDFIILFSRNPSLSKTCLLGTDEDLTELIYFKSSKVVCLVTCWFDKVVFKSLKLKYFESVRTWSVILSSPASPFKLFKSLFA